MRYRAMVHAGDTELPHHQQANLAMSCGSDERHQCNRFSSSLFNVHLHCMKLDIIEGMTLTASAGTSAQDWPSQHANSA